MPQDFKKINKKKKAWLHSSKVSSQETYFWLTVTKSHNSPKTKFKYHSLAPHDRKWSSIKNLLQSEKKKKKSYVWKKMDILEKTQIFLLE